MMTKPFLQDNKRERDHRKSFVIKIITISFVILIFLLSFYARGGLSAFFTGLITPFTTTGQNSLDEGAFIFKSLSAKTALLRENIELKKEIDKTNIYKLENQFLREENSKLNDLFNRVEDDFFVLAKVLSSPGKTMFDTLLIDIGKNNTKGSVSVGDTVRVSSNILIGDISEVFKKNSRVTLFSSPNRIIEVTFEEDSIGISAEGLGGGNFKALAPKDIVVKSGDLVYSTEYGGKIIGIVSAVLDEPSNPFIEIRFRLPVNPYELIEVFIYEREINS